MASHIERGESILIPFRNGLSISDSQLKPRMYKTRKGFEKHFPGHYLGKDGVELVEYAEVVRCKDCKYYEIHKPKVLLNCERNGYLIPMNPNDFCSYGERRTDD